MPSHIALLRGINVGGHKKVAMADLRALFEALGFAEAKSVLQSGNLVFQSDRRTGEALERLLETETEKRLGVAADYLVRTGPEWETVIARNPFPEEAVRDPSHLVVLFLKQEVQAKDVKALQAAIRGPEQVRGVGKNLYAIYPAGIGESKLTIPVIERTLGCRATGRNWNTVQKLAALLL